MNRRNFVAGIVGLFASVRAMASPKIVPLGEEGYTYSWSTNTTDDPRMFGVNVQGGRDVHMLWIDGRDVMDLTIYRVRTGPEGRIEYYLKNADGHHYEIPGHEGVLATQVEYGRVRYPPIGGFPLPRETRGAGG